MGIRAEHVGRSIAGRSVLEGVSCEIADGDFAVFLGPTGAGKTSLLRMLAGIDLVDRGAVYYDGQDMRGVPVRNRPIAMVYQQFVNYPSLTVFENIASPLRAGRQGLSAGEVTARVHEAAELLGLAGVLTHRPSEISGGQQQRTAIARALVKGAKYIFLDEPLANLDFKLREALRGELKHLFRKRGGAVIYATPDPVDALSMGTHVGMVLDGRLVQYGAARAVYDAPATVAVGEYFSYPAMNVVDAALDAQGTLRLSQSLVLHGQPEAPPGRYRAGFRAHALDLVRRSTADAALPATVQLSEVVGSDTEIHVRHESLPLTVLTEQVRRFDAGEAIELFLNPAEIFLFDADTGKLAGRFAASMAVEAH